jgi:hypothetical protein
MELLEFTTKQEQRIKDVVSAGSVDLQTVGQAVMKIRGIVRDTQQFIATYTFKDIAEEIYFFKTVKPAMVSSLLYHKKIFALLLFDLYSDRQRKLDNYYRVLSKYEAFASRHRVFYEYCVSGNTHMDHIYFSRATPASSEIDDKFSTLCDRKLAKILAHQTIRDFITQAVNRLESDAQPATLPKLQWTVSKVSLVELMYALYTCGVFNHGNAELKQIAIAFQAMFGIHLDNYAKVFAEVKMRKNGNTIFIDQMKERLSGFINDSY